MKRIIKNNECFFNCLLYEPKLNYEDEKLPLIVFLHGAGERGENFDLLENHDSLPIRFKDNPPVRAFMLAPICPEEYVWPALTPELKKFLDDFINKYPVDKDRVSMTGISMGGFGTWEFSMAYPELLSAIAPVCGGGMSWRADALVGMPIKIFHGDADITVPIEYSKLMYDKLKSVGIDADFTIYHGVGHNCWAQTYRDGELAKWLVAQNRKNRL